MKVTGDSVHYSMEYAPPPLVLHTADGKSLMVLRGCVHCQLIHVLVCEHYAESDTS
jgi:hypothetical protein